jgi:catechol 2,3-dioxygenase-like lactoylglutathione lyase family enzyme
MRVSRLTLLEMPGSAEAWAALAFDVVDGAFVVGTVRCTVGSTPGWGFDELRGSVDALGVPTRVADGPAASPAHANGIDRIDHVVYTVPDLDVAVDALTSVLGAPPRRRFHPRGPDGPEMAFFRVGEGFIEVVSSGQPASLMGVAFNSPDLDATVAAIREAGGPIGDPKPAVQGGRIASVWREHVAFPVAVMEPPAR